MRVDGPEASGSRVRRTAAMIDAAIAKAGRPGPSHSGTGDATDFNPESVRDGGWRTLSFRNLTRPTNEGAPSFPQFHRGKGGNHEFQQTDPV